MRVADLSVELGHFYMSDLQHIQGNSPSSETEDRIRTFLGKRIDVGYAALHPIVSKYWEQEKTVSLSVMIDDYFWTASNNLTRKDVADYVLNHCERTGIPLNFIVYESSLADSVEVMVHRIVERAHPGSGSQRRDRSEQIRWLSNGQMGRDVAPLSENRGFGIAMPETPSKAAYTEKTRSHSLHIDVELFDTPQKGEGLLKQWACPVLAAWWQLIRLGMLRDVKNNPSCPDDTVVINDEYTLFAKRTLTALSPDFLEIEAGVRTILSQVSIPEDWYAHLQDGPTRPEPDEHLSRIGYIFVADTFDPRVLGKYS